MQLILDPETWPSWQSEIVQADGPAPLGPNDVVQGRAEMLGFNVDGQSITRSVDDLAYEQDVVVGVGMRIEYRLRPTADGVEVTHSLTSLLPDGVMGRILSFFLARRLRRMQKELLERLTAQAEASSS